MDKKIKDAKEWAKTQIDSLDADYLLSHACNLNKKQLPLYLAQDSNMSFQQWALFSELVRRRINGEPVAYLIGSWGFLDYEFIVTPATLIPRPETETLVTTIIERQTNEMPLKVLELGTGSGAISISLGLARPNWQIIATDICPMALAVAQTNAKKLFAKNVSFYSGSWFDAVPKGQYFDLIVSNPPYISPNDPHLKNLSFEPQRALVALDDGFCDLNYIISNAKNWLYPYGSVILESASSQTPDIKAAILANGFKHYESIKDLSGNERVSIGYI